MKGLRATIICMLVVIAWVFAFCQAEAGESVVLHPGGANKAYYELVTDTVAEYNTDTVTTDTLDLTKLVPGDVNHPGPGIKYGDYYNQILITGIRDTVVRGDSLLEKCSTVVKIWTVDQAGLARALTAAIIPFSLDGDRDTSTTYRFWLNGMGSAASKDSVVFDKLFVQEIFHDTMAHHVHTSGAAALRTTKHQVRWVVWLMK